MKQCEVDITYSLELFFDSPRWIHQRISGQSKVSFVWIPWNLFGKWNLIHIHADTFHDNLVKVAIM